MSKYHKVKPKKKKINGFYERKSKTLKGLLPGAASIFILPFR